MSSTNFDLVIIGGGPGGYVGAIRASQLGLKTAVIECENLGGICLNWGCIPTKALLRTAEVYHLMQHAEDFGLSVSEVSFDIKKIVERSRNVAKKLSSGIGMLMKKHKVTVLNGYGTLAGKGQVKVEKDGKDIAMLRAKHIMLATGARARVIPGLEPDGKLIWTYKEAMVPNKIPKSLLVIGPGAIGIESASFYRTLGAEVTVVEVMDRVLPVEDAEISSFAHKSFEKQGTRIITEASVNSLKRGNSDVTADVEKDGKKESITVDKVILAVGIVGNFERLGLENTKIVVDKTHILVGPHSETGEPGVYAIGDLTGPPWLAHKASHEAIICVEKIAGYNPKPLDRLRIPGCTYCHPQIASVGMTEAKAIESGRQIKVGRFPFIGNGKAIALGDDQGLIKTVFDADTGELLGAHMVGSEVTELIQGYAVGMTLETTEHELMETVFPHPTLSEMMHESVLDAYDRVIHL